MDSMDSKKSESSANSVDKNNDNNSNTKREHVVEDFSIEYKRDVYTWFVIAYKT